MIPHGRQIYATVSNMYMVTICACPPFVHALPHWKFVLSCFYNFPRIDLPGQESDSDHSNTYPSIHFHIYHIIKRCKVNGRFPLDEKNCHLFLQDLDYVSPAKLYTTK